MKVSREALLSVLRRWPPARRYLVALSGGMDSSVLLALAASVRAELPGVLEAMHVDHGLHADSAGWARHCAGQCADLGVRFSCVRVDARPLPGTSPEALARKLRYGALARHLGEGGMLLTAHSLDDQAETVLLQLCRGAGPTGLAGMPALRPLGDGLHGRPLLEAGRGDIRRFAQAAGIQWIEDASNADPRFDRNFLRQEVLPRLKARWPELAATLARAARIQAQAAEILAAQARADLLPLRDASGTLDAAGLAAMPPVRRDNVLREWLRQAELPVPGPERLQHLEREVLKAKPDREPCLRWPGAELRRYRGRLYALPPAPPPDPRVSIRWRLAGPLALAHGCLEAEAVAGRGLRAHACPGGEVEVRFRLGGERLQPSPGGCRRPLKALLQEAGVPPWQRRRLPLIFVHDRLAAVAGLWVDAGFAAAAGEPGWQIRWTESPSAVS